MKTFSPSTQLLTLIGLFLVFLSADAVGQRSISSRWHHQKEIAERKGKGGLLSARLERRKAMQDQKRQEARLKQMKRSKPASKKKAPSPSSAPAARASHQTGQTNTPAPHAGEEKEAPLKFRKRAHGKRGQGLRKRHRTDLVPLFGD